MMGVRPASAILGTALVAVACQPPNTPRPAAEAAPRLKVSVLEIGRAVGADKRVTEPADRFLPRDTVYASVVTKGDDEEAVLEARWSFEGGVVSDTTQRIAQKDSAVTEFHVFDPSGWKPGRYRVEIFLDGTSVGQREFTVDISS
jgi:hypothetical protein